jgi:RNase H-fold protein (predicted Holliday junction resolvase)
LLVNQFSQDLLLIADRKTRQTRGDVDQVAAQIILQNYLDSRAQQKAAGGFIKSLN